MRFIIIPKAEPTAGGEGSCDFREDAFDERLFAAYMKYNEDLTKAGVLVASEGLDPDAEGARVTVKDGRRVVVDGPYAETKELVGGFYILDVKSRDEAVAWALRCPVGRGHEVLEIRKLTEISELPAPLREAIRANAPTWSARLWK